MTSPGNPIYQTLPTVTDHVGFNKESHRDICLQREDLQGKKLASEVGDFYPMQGKLYET